MSRIIYYSKEDLAYTHMMEQINSYFLIKSKPTDILKVVYL